MTKEYRREKWLLLILSILCNLLPIAIYTIKAFIVAGIGQKVTLGVCLTLSLLFVLINIITKHRIRSTLWILLIGIYVCLDHIQSLLIIMAITTIIDEFILEPAYKRVKNKYIINKEIDKRNQA